MPAPRDSIERLAAFVDERLRLLEEQLAQAHKPIYPIWAEAETALTTNGHDWSFGSGLKATGGLGITIPFRSGLVALALSVNSPGAFDTDAFDTDAFSAGSFSFAGVVEAEIEVEKDGIIQTDYSIALTEGLSKYQLFHTALIFDAGSVLNFRTKSETDSEAGNRIVAWMRKE